MLTKTSYELPAHRARRRERLTVKTDRSEYTANLDLSKARPVQIKEHCLGCKYDGQKTACTHPLAGETSFWKHEDGTTKIHTDDCYGSKRREGQRNTA